MFSIGEKMRKNNSFFIIFSVIAIPLILYFAFKPSSSDNSANLAQAIGSKPVVLDFSSEMCLECKEFSQILQPEEKKYSNKIFFKNIIINSDDKETKELLKKYNVKVVPTLVFIDKQGKVVRTTEGSIPKSTLENYLNQLENG